MFTRAPIRMMTVDGVKVFDAVVNVTNILSVFPFEVDREKLCSIMMIGGDKLTVNLPFTEFAERLLELRETPP